MSGKGKNVGEGGIDSEQLAVSSKQKKQNSPGQLTSHFSLLTPSPCSPPLFSIIIPTYNEAGLLGETLAGLPAAADVEIIVVDGGSTDGSREAASRFPSVRLLQTPKGRGLQMNTGARAARGDIFVFLHADTSLGPAHLAALRRAAADPGFRAGAFELLLTPPLPALRFIAWGANRRAHVLGLPYGDQALSLRRDLFEKLGGFSEQRPEDLDLVLRLRRYTRIRILTPPVASSGRKWRQQGYFRITLKNWLFFAYHLAERIFTSRWGGRGAALENNHL
ncbi:MAG: TIGR04283 family arsenosugar biosynthesis glycosyltransferase [Desulfobaccales bacterium]